MTVSIRDYVSNISVGPPISHERISIFPLHHPPVSALDYLLIDEAVEKEQTTVEEISQSATVPRLRVRNTGQRPVLVPDGTTLVGGKQNRTVNISIMLAPQSETDIPVSCIERGRWSRETHGFSPAEHIDSRMRAKMYGSALMNLAASDKVQVDQIAVWDDVESTLCGSGGKSATRAYHAAFAAWDDQIAGYEANLECPRAACGVAVQVEGQVEVVDLFDRPATLQSLWPKLRRSYAVAALRRKTAAGRTVDARDFVIRAVTSAGKAFERVGIGTSLCFQGDESLAAVLLCDDQLVHLSAFAQPATTQGDLAT